MVFVIMAVEEHIDLARREFVVQLTDHERWIDQRSDLISNENRIPIRILAVLFTNDDFDATKAPDVHVDVPPTSLLPRFSAGL
jgi:hypothetical protein